MGLIVSCKTANEAEYDGLTSNLNRLQENELKGLELEIARVILLTYDGQETNKLLAW